MRVKTKTLYYCDFCSMKRFRKEAMEKHERHCTMNPNRMCRWAQLEHGPRTRYDEHDFHRGLPRWVRLLAPLTEEKIDLLRDKTAGCPACTLAALRQSGVEYHYDHVNGQHIFNYEQEVKDFRKREHEQAMLEEMW